MARRFRSSDLTPVRAADLVRGSMAVAVSREIRPEKSRASSLEWEAAIANPSVTPIADAPIIAFTTAAERPRFQF